MEIVPNWPAIQVQTGGLLVFLDNLDAKPPSAYGACDSERTDCTRVNTGIICVFRYPSPNLL